MDDVRSWCEEDIVIIGYTRPNLPSCSPLIGNLYKLRTIVNGSAMLSWMVLALQQQESIEGRLGTGEADRGSQSHERDMRAGGKI